MGSLPNTTTSISSAPTTLKVAVIGGGIGGLALALGLLEHAHIDVQVYESAPSFGEIGAGVTIGPNAERALALISPAAKAALDRTATSNIWKSKADTFADYFVGKGDNAGELIYSLKGAAGIKSVHRAHFLDELVKSVPAQRAHFNKRLQSIEDKNGDPVILQFTDGTTATADVVIGADGIHSTVRKYLLGAEAAKPMFTGSVFYRGIVPMDSAVEKLGAEFAQNATILCGPGRAFMTYPIDGGKLLNIGAMDMEHPIWEHETWIIPTQWDTMAQRYEGWGKHAQGILELLNTPNLATWAIHDTSPASTYTRRRVAMLGDAAHASTPFQGQGAGQAIEDALVINTVLSKVQTLKQLPSALAAYNQIRRPRAQRNVETSREKGRLLAMMMEGVNDDLDKMREELGTRMNWLWQRNLEAQSREAVELFEESL